MIQAKLTMHISMATARHGAPFMTGPAFRYKVDEMPHGQDAFIINVRSGTPRKAIWRIKLGSDFLEGEHETAETALTELENRVALHGITASEDAGGMYVEN